ncbi:MAG: response regulator [Gammaproteobacteria bacterium SHHR-1]
MLNVEYRLITAHEGGMGLQLAQAMPPDLVLLDINMPDMDGFAVLEALKTDANLCSIPVITLTANAMPRDIERGLAAGFSDYITKPIDQQVFFDTIDACLDPSKPAA